MKAFQQALIDGFTHIVDISDPQTLKQLREEGILCDDEGYYSYSFGDHKEFELAIEPLKDEGSYQISLYRNRIRLTEPLLIWTK